MVIDYLMLFLKDEKSLVAVFIFVVHFSPTNNVKLNGYKMIYVLCKEEILLIPYCCGVFFFFSFLPLK